VKLDFYCTYSNILPFYTLLLCFNTLQEQYDSFVALVITPALIKSM
jgi:hypothetical protein